MGAARLEVKVGKRVYSDHGKRPVTGHTIGWTRRGAWATWLWPLAAATLLGCGGGAGEAGDSEGVLTAQPGGASLPEPLPPLEPPSAAERIGYQMIEIPPGTFTMGSPRGEGDPDEGQASVTVAAFSLGETEVGQGQWRGLMGSQPISSRDRRWMGRDGEACAQYGVGDELPMHCISWFEALEFCNRLSALEDLPPFYELPSGERAAGGEAGYRLPTEAEWEYAARGGIHRRFAGTDDPTQVCAYANVATAATKGRHSFLEWDVFPCSDPWVTLAPVGSLLANPFGLKDMTGNVWEWTEDWYDNRNRSKPSPKAKVVRGAAWHNMPADSRVANRYYGGPTDYSYYVGFRVARTTTEPSAEPAEPEERAEDIAPAALPSVPPAEAPRGRVPERVLARLQAGAPITVRSAVYLGCDELWMAQRWVYARHGALFEDEAAAGYFGAQEGYRPMPGVTEQTIGAHLTPSDVRNHALLASERARRCR